jgi:TatD DNase family protein
LSELDYSNWNLVDAHFHYRQVKEKQDSNNQTNNIAGVNSLRLRSLLPILVSSCHDLFDYEAVTKAKQAGLLASFGIHPQYLDSRCEDLLVQLANEGKLVAIGECGFDFYINKDLESYTAQLDAFMFQLDLALSTRLPLIVHCRKATHMIFKFAKELSRLSAVIFHSWSGTLHEALSILDKGILAWFSFGTPLLWNARRAHNCIIGLPCSQLLCESDAPWQAPRSYLYSPQEIVWVVIRCMYDLVQKSRYPYSASLEQFTFDLWENARRAYRLTDTNHWGWA